MDEKTIGQKYVTYDFERQMQGATKAKTSEFGCDGHADFSFVHEKV